MRHTPRTVLLICLEAPPAEDHDDRNKDVEFPSDAKPIVEDDGDRSLEFADWESSEVD